MSKLDPLIQQLDLRDRLVFFGFASEEELKCLLQGCRLFVFPSLMEGFGLPLAEALACGAPVVCSNAASLPEVGGDAVCFFDPRNPQDCANQMLQVLENDQLRRRLQESGLKRAALFRWENSVRVLADAYNALLQQRFEQSPGIRSK